MFHKKCVMILISIVLLLSLSACGLTKESVMNVIAPTDEPKQMEQIVHTEDNTEEDQTEQIACKDISEHLSPFFPETDGDTLLLAATQLPLLGYEGEESPTNITVTEKTDGSATVSIEINSGIRFSDGEPLTADDIIFTYYVLLDSDYDGPYQVNSLPVKGVQDFSNGTQTDLYEKYGLLYDELYANGTYDKELQNALTEAINAVPHNKWNQSQAQKAVDEYDSEKAQQIKDSIEQAWRNDMQDIVDFCMQMYGDSVEYRTGYKLDEVNADDNLKIMYAMVEWSLCTLSSDGSLVNKRTGEAWDMVNEFPTLDDMFAEFYESYAGSAEKYWQVEGVGRSSMLEKARNSLIAQWAADDKQFKGDVNYISGIVRAGDRLIEITLDSYNESYVDILTNINIIPQHFYASNYDYANAEFGFKIGDLSLIRQGMDEIVGAGHYILDTKDESNAYLSLNEYYFAMTDCPAKIQLTTGPLG